MVQATEDPTIASPYYHLLTKAMNFIADVGRQRQEDVNDFVKKMISNCPQTVKALLECGLLPALAKLLRLKLAPENESPWETQIEMRECCHFATIFSLDHCCWGEKAADAKNWLHRRRPSGFETSQRVVGLIESIVKAAER